jgi:hypothetical protein
MLNQSVPVPIKSVFRGAAVIGGNINNEANVAMPQSDQVCDGFTHGLPVVRDHVIGVQVFEIAADQNKRDLVPLKVRDVPMIQDIIPGRWEYYMPQNPSFPMFAKDSLFLLKGIGNILCPVPRTGTGKDQMIALRSRPFFNALK